MKKIKWICFLLSLALLLPISVSAADGAQNWYFTQRTKNTRPELPALDAELGFGIGKEEKVLYLTFDAGYENGNVAKIVDVLKENDVTGAFFVLSHFVTANPELVKTMRANGNLICNHTATHKNITKISTEEIQSQIRRLEEEYQSLTGEALSPYFRPPEGTYSASSLKVVHDLGYRTVFWSVAYADWDNNKQMAPEKALAKLESLVHDGAVILLHPTSATNAAILDKFIHDMKEKGYRFGSLNEL